MQQASVGITLPAAMTPPIQEVLSMGRMHRFRWAEAMRKRGHELPFGPDATEAAVIWYLLPFAVKHGLDWRVAAVKDLKPQDEFPYLPGEPSPHRPLAASPPHH